MNNKITSDHTSFLPDFCSTEVLFVVVLSTELLAIILSLALPIYNRDLLFDLAMNSLFVQWIALSCMALLCLFKRYLNNLSVKKIAFISFSIILAVTLIIAELAWWTLHTFPGHYVLSPESHINFILRTVSISAIVGTIVLRYLYIQHQWRKNIEITAQSRFQALQSRIRPHFLFNCMNTIASLTRKAPALAEESIEDLADLFRATLLEQNELVRLEEEWRICETYLRIEKHRLDKRLQLEWKIDTLPKDAMVPPLILQPLMENAIYHGIEQLAEGGMISICGEVQTNKILIKITNPVPPPDMTDRHRGTKHALENIQLRLKARYNNQCRLLTERNDTHYIVDIELPYETNENSNR